jgi:hypothetical protein
MSVTIEDLANALREHRQLTAEEARLLEAVALVMKVVLERQ